MTNMFKRTMEKLAGWIDRENDATSLNTAEPEEEHADPRNYAAWIDWANSVSRPAEPDWKAIAEELAEGLGDLIDAMLSQKPPISECMAVRAARIKARKLLTSYQAAKQVKP
jgi:hypothetical protein